MGECRAVEGYNANVDRSDIDTGNFIASLTDCADKSYGEKVTSVPFRVWISTQDDSCTCTGLDSDSDSDEDEDESVMVRSNG